MLKLSGDTLQVLAVSLPFSHRALLPWCVMSPPQRAKFRWTENLTCRFIQLRKENRKLFTGRKYSAQTGWECILRQMRREFPSIMAGVHCKVLKKKWSNLLQQYKSNGYNVSQKNRLFKELKNPVHGDRNNADDVSWPFYSAIDEVVGQPAFAELYIDPQEFLCVSVTPEEASRSRDALPAESNSEIGPESGQPFLPVARLRSLADCSIEIERVPRTRVAPREISGGRAKGKHGDHGLSASPRASDLSTEKLTSPMAIVEGKKSSRIARNSGVVESTRNKGQTAATRNEDEERPRKRGRSRAGSCHESHESPIDRRIDRIFEYTKRRDRENRSIMMRMLHAVESIASKL